MFDVIAAGFILAAEKRKDALWNQAHQNLVDMKALQDDRAGVSHQFQAKVNSK